MSSKDFDVIAKAIENGRGVFFLSGHFSNWELVAFSFPILRKYSLNIIAKRQASKNLNQLINDYRTLSGNKIIETGMTLKEALRVVKQKKPVCFLVDQAGHPDYSVYAEFFRMNVASFAGPAKMALSERPELVFTYMVREPNFEFRVHSKIILYDDLSDKSKENVEILTQRIQKEVERAIREHPDQWLWFHKRFKHSRR